MLNVALLALEQNNIHMLVWGGTRMAGFRDACKQSSSILVPFLDTLIAGNIRKEVSAYMLSAKGLYTLELFADLHVFACQFLQCVDSDKILSCEVFQVTDATAKKLIDPNLSTPKADVIYNGLHCDDYNNAIVTLTGNNTQILNEKLSRNKTLDSIKEELLST